MCRLIVLFIMIGGGWVIPFVNGGVDWTDPIHFSWEEYHYTASNSTTSSKHHLLPTSPSNTSSSIHHLFVEEDRRVFDVPGEHTTYLPSPWATRKSFPHILVPTHHPHQPYTFARIGVSLLLC